VRNLPYVHILANNSPAELIPFGYTFVEPGGLIEVKVPLAFRAKPTCNRLPLLVEGNVVIADNLPGLVHCRWKDTGLIWEVKRGELAVRVS